MRRDFRISLLYQGLAGIVDNTCTGIILATLYLSQRRKVWVQCYIPWLIDSIVLLIFCSGARTSKRA